MNEQSIPAGEFKAKCLQIMDEVNRLHHEVVITKHGKPVAKLVPYMPEKPKLFGKFKDQIKVTGDILVSFEEEWNV